MGDFDRRGMGDLDRAIRLMGDFDRWRLLGLQARCFPPRLAASSELGYSFRGIEYDEFEVDHRLDEKNGILMWEVVYSRSELFVGTTKSWRYSRVISLRCVPFRSVPFDAQ